VEVAVYDESHVCCIVRGIGQEMRSFEKWCWFMINFKNHRSIWSTSENFKFNINKKTPSLRPGLLSKTLPTSCRWTPPRAPFQRNLLIFANQLLFQFVLFATSTKSPSHNYLKTRKLLFLTPECNSKSFQIRSLSALPSWNLYCMGRILH